MDLFRAQKYVNQNEVDYMYRKRRKSWTGGTDSVELMTLILRQTVHESDVKILEKTKIVQESSSKGSSKGILSSRMKEIYPINPVAFNKYNRTIGRYPSTKNISG